MTYFQVLFALLLVPITFHETSTTFAQPPAPRKPQADAKPTTRRVKPKLPAGFAARTIKLPNGAERKCAVFVPPQYVVKKDYKWPVVVFLHGSAECGTDGIKQTTVGLPRFLAANPSRHQFVAAMPQATTTWFRGDDAAAVFAAIELVHSEFRTDPERVYLTGLSMGGFATWELAMLRPDLFAAIMPVCGVGNKAFVSNIVHLPVWAFHGTLDKNVPVSGSREPIAELERLGATPKFTEFPQLGHVCWNEVYGSKQVLEWLLAQKRKPAPRVIDYKLPRGFATAWWLGIQADEDLKTPAHIRAEIQTDGRVTLESEGVAGWAIKSHTHPLKIGDKIHVTWNGKLVYDGEFTGGVAVKPETKNNPSSRPRHQNP